MKTLIIDNYDSFTYNLYQYLAELSANPVVFRNDEISLSNVVSGAYTHIVLSPGPGSPEVASDVGVCLQLIRELSPSIPILGVCLGHQALLYEFGAPIISAPSIRHGKTSLIEFRPVGLFEGLGLTSESSSHHHMEVMRYHSLVGDPEHIPECFEILAVSTDDKSVQAVRHKEYPLFGVQFHPESVGTPDGKRLLCNFLKIGA